MVISGESLCNNKWTLRPGDAEQSRYLSNVLDIPPVLARVLVARGIDTPEQARAFLGVSAESMRFDPWQMKDMDKAVEHLVRAIKTRESICIYGDYDADGTAATALLLRFFRWLGIKADYYIPHRVGEGYGLNLNALQSIINKGHTLLLTVDTGATAVEEVEFANAHGLRVIITDHHRLTDRLPPAVAVVDPARADCPYPYSELSGVGVAYKLITALCDALSIDPEQANEFLNEHLDLVALGTIADVVPLTGENRRFVRDGLEILNRTTNIGLSCLIEALRIREKKISSRDVSFILAPRINAAGRTSHASLAVELLLTDDPSEAERLAKQLNRLNERRQRLEAEILARCHQQIQSSINLDEDVVIVSALPGLHEGLLGLVAGRLAEEYCRPVLVLNVENEVVRGSGRSFGEFSLFEALTHCRDYLTRFGGHHLACGLQLKSENISPFKQAINAFARKHIDKLSAEHGLVIDTFISPAELNLKLMEALEELEPYGEGNPAPVFMIENVFMIDPPRVVGSNHLKLVLTDKTNTFYAIGFEMGSLATRLQSYYKRRPITLAFQPIINEWNNECRVELKIKDIKV
ncbi:single-stranded-DNA-specific exonuclease RecJ [Candidatus Sumerlaeota bacterium]|nr:single-stranded-DNA-specific exonuclease RecJ [Candidatus Sumerlaeota bacterium]